MAVYAVILGYLSLDLYVFHGPVAKWTGAGLAGRGPSSDWVARVYGQPVTRDELSAAVAAHLALRGETVGDYAPGQSRLAVQVHVLENLIAERVLATWAADEPDSVTNQEVDRALSAIEQAVAGPGSLGQQLAAAGSSIPVLRSLIRERLRASDWVEDAIRGACEVSEDEVDDAVRRAAEAAQLPEAIRVRHLVVAGGSAGGDTESRLVQLRESAAGVERSLAAVVDGWIAGDPRQWAWRDEGFASDPRIPQGVREAVRDLPAGAVAGPFRSAAGWHLAEVAERLPMRELDAGDARDEVRARLVSARRRAAVDALQQQLVSRPARHIERFYANLISHDPRPDTSPSTGAAPGSD